MPLAPGDYNINIRVHNSVGHEDSGVFTWTVLPDVTAPIISNVSAGTPGVNVAIITWDTNENSTGNVEYGLTTGYGSTAPTPADTTPDTMSHSVTLSSLNASETYFFRVTSTDFGGNSTQNTGSFTTDAISTSPVWLPDGTGTERRLVTDDADGGGETWDINGLVTGTVTSWDGVADSTPAPVVTSGVIQWPAMFGTSVFHVSATNSGGTSESTFPPFIWDRIGVKHTISTAPSEQTPGIGNTAVFSIGIGAHPVNADIYYRWEALYTFVYTPAINGQPRNITTFEDAKVVFGGQVTDSTLSTLTITNCQIADNRQIRCRVRAYDPDYPGMEIHSTPVDLTTTITPDTRGPIVSGVDYGAPTMASATITWDTDEDGTSSVGYSTTPGDYTTNVTPPTVGYVSSHSVDLINLLDGTQYYFKVFSPDVSGNLSTGADTDTFTTDVAPIQYPPDWSTITPQTTRADNLPGYLNLVASGFVTSAAGPLTNWILVGSPVGFDIVAGIIEAEISAAEAIHPLIVRVSNDDGTEDSDQFTWTIDPAPDIIGPVVTNISSGTPTETGATITWDTLGEDGDSSVGYSINPGDYSTVEGPDGNFVANHSVSLTLLSADTQYYFTVFSPDVAGNPSTGSPDTGTFTTDVAAGFKPVWSTITPDPRVTDDNDGLAHYDISPFVDGGGAPMTFTCVTNPIDRSTMVGSFLQYPAPYRPPSTISIVITATNSFGTTDSASFDWSRPLPSAPAKIDIQPVPDTQPSGGTANFTITLSHPVDAWIKVQWWAENTAGNRNFGRINDVFPGRATGQDSNAGCSISNLQAGDDGKAIRARIRVYDNTAGSPVDQTYSDEASILYVT